MLMLRRRELPQVRALKVAVALCLCAAVTHGSEIAEAGQSAEPAATYRLEFRDSPWLEVLKWYAAQAQLNLDWQELPEGNVNLSAQEAYTLPAVLDTLNMQLLARGYTLLERAEVLRIVPLKDIDPTLVPRVEPEDLAECPPHQFVRVSFPLDWLVGEHAATLLQPLLSPYGKLIPLPATNNLEAIDAVVNLRELWSLLNREQSDQGRQRLVEEFVVKHRRASDIADKVRQLLGVSSSNGRRQASPDDRLRLDIERTRLQSQAVEKLGKDARDLLKTQGEIHIVVNEERNSILMNAPPDKIETARQAIAALDQPRQPKDDIWQDINRVRTYELGDADLDAIQDMLDELQSLGSLEPDTRIEIDSQTNRLMVYATATDHLLISHVIQGMEKEPRQAEVVPLKSLEPRYAARAIQTMFTQSRPSGRGRWSRGNEDGFRVQADLVHNRLLLWASRSEMLNVHQLLEKLGESQSDQIETTARYRVIESPGKNLSEIERRLRRLWSSISDAPLTIETLNGTRPASGAPQQADGEDASQVKPAAADEPDSDQTASHSTQFEVRTVARRLQVDLADDEDRADELDGNFPADNEPSDEPAGGATATGDDAAPTTTASSKPVPVRIIESSDGKLIIASRDPATAGLLQQVLTDLLTEQEDMKVFPLQHASAFSVKYQIEDWLAAQQPEDDEAVDVLAAPTETSATVFADSRTNRLLIRNASPEQLKLIGDLVLMLDKPEEVDPELARRQEIYRVQNKRAADLAETVKEVYRDLLSATDKAFSGNNGDRSRRGSSGYWGFADSRTKVPTYQGLLAVGVEESSNSVVVSAPAYLLTEVLGLLKRLDSLPAGTTTRVLPLANGNQSQVIQEALTNVTSSQTGDSSQYSRTIRQRRGN